MSDIGLPKGMSRDDAYIQGVADGEQRVVAVLRKVLEFGIEDELDGGILGCRFCEATNGDNEPPEDDAIRHEDDCVGIEAQQLVEEYAD